MNVGRQMNFGFAIPDRAGGREEEEEEEEEEAVFIRDSIANEDPPNARQVQHRPKEEEVVVLSLLVKIERNPLNT